MKKAICIYLAFLITSLASMSGTHSHIKGQILSSKQKQCVLEIPVWDFLYSQFVANFFGTVHYLYFSELGRADKINNVPSPENAIHFLNDLIAMALCLVRLDDHPMIRITLPLESSEAGRWQVSPGFSVPHCLFQRTMTVGQGEQYTLKIVSFGQIFQSDSLQFLLQLQFSHIVRGKKVSDIHEILSNCAVYYDTSYCCLRSNWLGIPQSRWFPGRYVLHELPGRK
jgi:hypothetical protein